MIWIWKEYPMSNIQYQISNFSPLLKFKISGHSMEPTIQAGSSVLVSSFPYLLNSPKIDDIVAVKFDGKVLIKRVGEIEKNKYFITGDNPNDSYDSRRFGMIGRRDIIGKVIRII